LSPQNSKGSFVSKCQRYIEQVGKTVRVGRHSPSPVQESTIEITCHSTKASRELALSLAGVRLEASTRLEKCRKLQTHPWYGTVLVEDLSVEDRQFIVFFVQHHEELSQNEFALKVHRLFLDERKRGDSHAVIQEVLSLCK